MGTTKLYVGNLKYSATIEDLAGLFKDYGEVKEVKIIEGKGFGFVELSTPEEAEEAKEELDGTEFMGRTLRVNDANPPKKRFPGKDDRRR